MTKPTVGRIVHYKEIGDFEDEVTRPVYAALVTKVNEDGSVALRVFLPDASDRKTVNTEYGPQGGQWMWPPKA